MGKNSELYERTCDALSLAYPPSAVLASEKGEKFYIPSVNVVVESFGYSLNKILGKNSKNIEKRIKNGADKLILKDNGWSLFGMYLDRLPNIFENSWKSNVGPIFRFSDWEKEEAIKNFSKYWNKKEKEQWKQIQKYMREFAKKNF